MASDKKVSSLLISLKKELLDPNLSTMKKTYLLEKIKQLRHFGFKGILPKK